MKELGQATRSATSVGDSMKRLHTAIGVSALLAASRFLVGCGESGPIDLASWQKTSLAAADGEPRSAEIIVVTLRGKLNHFGRDVTQTPPASINYHATVPHARVWLAEFPSTRDMDIRSDETGWWTIRVAKLKGVDLDVSLVYEKEGWVTTKSNRIRVTDEDNLDIAIQFIDPGYYNLAVKPTLEANLSKAHGAPVTIDNAMVVTVGKPWASMHDDRLPHGDPGATVVVTPNTRAIGPIYFNEAVTPDVTYKATSVDGGVAWINVPTGVYDVTANKDGSEYETVTFVVNESDSQYGIVLYIASPPDSVQGKRAHAD